jgi:23S rRNA (uracil1939-C5)-methyltransferase
MARLTVDGGDCGACRRAKCDAEVRLPPGGFLQASREAESVRVGLVKEGVGRAKRIADLFARIGTFTFALAGTAEVDVLEQD